MAKAVWEPDVLGQGEFSHILLGTVLHYYHRSKTAAENMEKLLFLFLIVLNYHISERRPKKKGSWNLTVITPVRK